MTNKIIIAATLTTFGVFMESAQANSSSRLLLSQEVVRGSKGETRVLCEIFEDHVRNTISIEGDRIEQSISDVEISSSTIDRAIRQASRANRLSGGGGGTKNAPQFFRIDAHEPDIEPMSLYFSSEKGRYSYLSMENEGVLVLRRLAHQHCQY